MRLNNIASWRMSLDSASAMMDCALWIRAAERLQIPPDPLVPGPLDIDRPPSPISTGDQVIAEQWLGWWLSLIAPHRENRPLDQTLEPAHDTPDPLGLAPYPLLAALVARRWPQAIEWHNARRLRDAEQHPAASLIPNLVVQDLERTVGRRMRPFNLEFILLPVRDDVIRRVDDERYLVPERVFHGPGWAAWLRGLVSRIG